MKRQLYLLLVSLIWVLSACGSTAADAAITHQQTVGDLQIKLEHPQQAFVLQDYDFKVNVSNTQGQAIDQATVYLNLDMPDMHMPPQQPLAQNNGNGNYSSTTLFSMEGTWHINVHVIYNGQEHIATFEQQALIR